MRAIFEEGIVSGRWQGFVSPRQLRRNEKARPKRWDFFINIEPRPPKFFGNHWVIGCGGEWPLQSLRFVAALMVVYVHAAQLAVEQTGSYGFFPRELPLAGQAGVDIFFVISGVIIARTAVGLSWQDFAWKRFRRIIPFYFLVLHLRAADCCPFRHRHHRPRPARIVLSRARDGYHDAAASARSLDALLRSAVLCGGHVGACRQALAVSGASRLFIAAMALRQHGAVFQFLGNPLVLEFLFGVAIAYAPAFQPAKWAIPLGAALLIGAGFFDLAPLGNSLEYLRGEEAFQRVARFGLLVGLDRLGRYAVQGPQKLLDRTGRCLICALSHACSFHAGVLCDLESDPHANRSDYRDQHCGERLFRLAHPSGN